MVSAEFAIIFITGIFPAVSALLGKTCERACVPVLNCFPPLAGPPGVASRSDIPAGTSAAVPATVHAEIPAAVSAAVLATVPAEIRAAASAAVPPTVSAGVFDTAPAVSTLRSGGTSRKKQCVIFEKCHAPGHAVTLQVTL